MPFKSTAVALLVALAPEVGRALQVEVEKPHQKHGKKASQHESLKVDKSEKHKKKSPKLSFGDDACACVGISGLTGNATVTIDGEKIEGLYPASLGSSCQAWDEGLYPGSCDGKKAEDWCAKQWCYVDPCKCSIGTNPSPSNYLAGATYEGKQLFYSYATCGSKNTYNEPPSEAQEKECSKPLSAKFGSEECPCVGIEGTGGFTDVLIDKKTLSNLYPSDIGASCQAWDDGRYPGSCDGTGDAEDWCKQKWCYVDAKNCNATTPPTKSKYIADGQFQGNDLYYSYVTCGSGARSFDCFLLIMASMLWSYMGLRV